MTLLLYDPVFLEHDTGDHPECPERLRAVVEHFRATGLWSRCEVLRPRRAEEADVLRVHTPAYVRLVRELAESGGGAVDPETIVSARTWEAALAAVGAGMTAVDRILEAGSGTALCLVRPPGHHATPARGMGFCLFNNVAATARYIQARHGLKRVLIVDFDCHHGNGTQEAFYSDPSVHYLSVHRAPYYPGTGWEDERGRGAGLGATTNVPVGYATPPEEYLALFAAALESVVPEFRPEFVLVSAGFDGHRADPVGGLGLREEDFGTLTRRLIETLRPVGPVRVCSMLEGGYHPRYLPLSAAAHLEALIEGA